MAEKGPIFIVGMPRSGTKLLRDLLNRNPGIAIASIESHFIPGLVSEFGPEPKLQDEDRARRFYTRFCDTPFYYNAEREFGPIDYPSFRGLVGGQTWSDVFESLLRHFAPPGREVDSIWGDKTPAYLDRLDVLREIIPNVRFLHIIRDPRDCALSINKIWGRSLFRAAEMWRRKLSSARRHGLVHSERYWEIKYEDLLTGPEQAMRSVCTWLEIPFRAEMTELIRPSEDLGDTRGRPHIVSSNREKYRTELTQGQIHRIEEIVYPLARDLGYELHYAEAYRPVAPLSMEAYRILDGVASLRFHIQQKGWRSGARYYWALHQLRAA